MKAATRTLLFVTLTVLVGCRSRVVNIKLINTSQKPLSIIVVDYPTATFGVDKLESGATYQYAIKPLGTGPLNVQFTDADGHNHTYTGPALHKNDEGSVTVQLTQNAASAQSSVSQP
ncbi:MAG TPA: hypothetical protein VJV96_10590 [Candidatus Angelobacter sp.]|jgi:hypothetical protein|nr:hypothetical protein [Candidatus Angelobacter sp.]